MENRGFKDIILDLFDLVTFLVFIGWIVLFVRFFVFNPYTVVWESMSPTFHESDFIIVDKITSRYWTLKRGDVIVFIPPGKDIPYIKRIVWLPWETIKVKDWSVFICTSKDKVEKCDKMVEDYIPSEVQTNARCWITEFPVWSGFFVLWDNREHSTDSLCCFGLWCYNSQNYIVPNQNIIGKVYFKIYPDFWQQF